MNSTPASASFDAIFKPTSIAVLGGSADPSKFGSRLVMNLRACGFSGEVMPVSRSASEIGGYRAFPSLRDLPHAPDLVLVSIPLQHVPLAIGEAGEIGTKAAVVYSAGFAETGDTGRALQDEVLAQARRSSLRMIGPNCLGVRNFHYAMNATPMTVATPDAGPIAFISQSGAFGNAAFAALRKSRAGLSKLASIGNMADINHADLIRYCGEDEETSVIATFIEGVPDSDELLDAVATVSARKPIVVLKGGRSKTGQAAALSHTSSLAGDGRIWASLLREAGASLVQGSDELFDVASAFARAGTRLPRGRRVGVITLAGGPAVVAADHCDDHALELPMLDTDLAAIQPIVPAFASLRNPVDITGQTRPENFSAAIGAVAALPQLDGILGIAIGLDIPEYAQGLCDAAKSKPLLSCVVAPNSEDLLAANGVANFPSVERAVRAFAHLADRGTRVSLPAERIEPANSRAIEPDVVLTEAQSKAYLASFGLPITREIVCSEIDATVQAAEQIGYPVAIKVSSAEVAHKSDRGGVLLDLKDASSVRAAFGTLRDRFPGADVLVQAMAPRGLELIIGAQRTAQTGVVVMIGIGGVLTEILDDVVFCRAPATHARVASALKNLRARRLLGGYRGGPPLDIDAIAGIAARLSAVVAANPRIAEVDLNPVIAYPDGALIVDALIRTAN